jgi:outer membrane protein insertion porin family
MGANITFGYPISETASLKFELGVENASIKIGDEPATIITDFLSKEGDDFTNIKGVIGWTDSTLNHGLLPTRGYSQKVSMRLAVSDIGYPNVMFAPMVSTL